MRIEQILRSVSDDVRQIDKYWRASNYITVAQMYLKGNVLLKEDLTPAHLKDSVAGHWGASPGINFIYAHINAFICRTSSDVALVIGTGHAAGALISNLFLEGTLGDYYPEFDRSELGFTRLCRAFGSIDGFRSEMSPRIPGTIYDGGELGYGLSVAYGAALDNPDTVTVCVIGDGEGETGPTAAAWHGNKFINPKTTGGVLPIINLNGYKMGGPSVFATMSDRELMQYFLGLGYDPYIVHALHEQMYRALDRSYELLVQNRKRAEIGDAKFGRWPVIIMKSPKGWTIPDLESNRNVHKNPIERPHENVEFLEKWLQVYRPDDLFHDGQFLASDIQNVIPRGDLRIGKAFDRTTQSVNQLALPPIEHHAVQVGSARNVSQSSMHTAARYLSDVMNLNKETRNFRIMSPDELASNGLGEILIHTSKAYNRNTTDGSDFSLDGRVMEILSEHTCHAWLQGFIQSGRNGIMPTYEAFASICTSMTSQYAKYLYQSQKVPWRKATPSLNILLTSVCWSNTYSHQNPEYVGSLVRKTYSFVRCYYPCDANTLLVCLEECLRSQNRINVVTASKRELPQWLHIDQARHAVSRGFVELPYGTTQAPHVVLVAIGDHATAECNHTVKELSNHLPHIRIRCISIIDLTVLGSPTIFPHALSNQDIEMYFPSSVPIVINFHGYASDVKALIFERFRKRDVTVVGYSDQGDTSAPELYKMMLNGVSRYQIAIKVAGSLLDQGVISQRECETFCSQMDNQIWSYIDNLNL